MAEQEPDITGLVEAIVTSLVDEPEQVRVASSEQDGSLVVEIHVASDDTGKVIGRQGRIIKAIRTLARASASYTGGQHIEVEVVD
ncbi:MAG: KH domain-containing protein [Coriobacteriales bacterium]|jgi:predicted RNA-binding protein YlqC (UPF0109 family)|nr:KH domain-containing protein [Coriobacteriales bacterium]